MRVRYRRNIPTIREFDAMARELGYVKLDGIDVERVRRAYEEGLFGVPPANDVWQVLLSLARQVLAALDQENTP